MKKFLLTNSFVVGILVVVGLAWLWSEPGTKEGGLPLDLLKTWGVFFIFFSQGVTLPSKELRRGVTEWRLHLCIQLTTFVVFPILVALGLIFSQTFFQESDLRLGFLYLAFLPTTITSAVALTSVAGGNVSGALFNCTLSAVAGVFLVPTLSVFFIESGGSGAGLGLGGLFGSIALTILLPLALGQASQRWLQEVFVRHKAFVRRFNSGVILFIVWTAFSESFQRDIWSRVSGGDLLLTLVGTILLLLGASGLVWFVSGLWRFDWGSRITAFYCGGQKSLAMGLPLSAIIFAGSETVELSLLLIPLLCYHPLQLILGGWLMPRFRPAETA